MRDESDKPKELPGVVRFSLSVVAVVLFFAGGLLVIMGTTEFLVIRILGLTVPHELPGLIVIVLALVLLFRAGRRVKGVDNHDAV